MEHIAHPRNSKIKLHQEVSVESTPQGLDKTVIFTNQSKKGQRSLKFVVKRKKD